MEQAMEQAHADEIVRRAAAALDRAGLVHAYGHCSARVDDCSFMVSAPHSLRIAARLPGTLCPIDGPLPEGVLGEVRVHQQIYARRPEVGGICRVMPPVVMALSTASVVPLPRHGIGAYFDRLPLWDDPRLLRDDAAAQAVAEALGNAPAIVLRGNGAIVAAENLPKTVTLAWFLEDAARVERDVRALGGEPGQGLLSPAEIRDRQVWSGGVVERMWDYLGG
jgi:HCOMODA/2-hydroxy-3-carboxy-muconic semialdehyde decarboxylase